MHTHIHTHTHTPTPEDGRLSVSLSLSFLSLFLPSFLPSFLSFSFSFFSGSSGTMQQQSWSFESTLGAPQRDSETDIRRSGCPNTWKRITISLNWATAGREASHSLRKQNFKLSGPLWLRVQSRSRTRLRIAASFAILFRTCFKGVLDTIAPLPRGWAPQAV